MIGGTVESAPRARPDSGAGRSPIRRLGFLILAAGTLFLFGGVLLGFRVLSDSDILCYFYPLKTAIRTLWRNGSSLLWNPFLGEGQRLAGNPEHEIFYPFTWLLFLLPVAWALAITVAAHLVAGWLGMRRLLGRLGCSEPASILGAIAWGFGGLWISSSTHFLPAFLGWAWIPHLAAGAAEGPSDLRGAARDSFFGALLLLVGEPVTALGGGLGYAAVFLREPVTFARLRRAAWTAILSLAMAAVVLVPGAAVARNSIRWSGIEESLAEEKSFPPARLTELIVPRATGNVVSHNDREYFAWRLYPEKKWPFYPGLYGGALLVPLALAGTVGRFRRNRSILLVGAVAFVLALGAAGGAWTFLRLLPLWKGIRYPEKFLAPAMFCAIVLMASGFDRTTESPASRRAVGLWLVSLGAILGLAAALPGLWTPLLAGLVPDAERFFPAVVVRAALAHLLLAIFFLLPERVRLRGAVVSGFLVGAAIDVLASSRDFIRTWSVAEMESKPPVVTVLEKVRPRPRVVDLLPEEPPVPVAGADELNGPWDRNRVLGDQLVQFGIPLALEMDFAFTYSAATNRARRLLSGIAAADPGLFAELLAQRSACGLLVWKRPITLEDPVRVVGVGGCRPEVDSVTSVVSFHGDEEFRRLANENRGKLARTVFVEESYPGTPSPEEATLAVTGSKTDALTFDVDCPSSCLVRIARTRDPNWRVFLDGAAVRSLAVNLSLIGIEIPSGRHRVELRYRDGLLMLSGGISLAGLLVATSLALAGGRRRAS